MTLKQLYLKSIKKNNNLFKIKGNRIYIKGKYVLFTDLKTINIMRKEVRLKPLRLKDILDVTK